MHAFFRSFKDRVDLAIDKWMLDHGGNRSCRMGQQISAEQLMSYVDYLVETSRVDDTPFGKTNPIVHYNVTGHTGKIGIDFISQYLMAFHGYKGVTTYRGRFKSHIVVADKFVAPQERTLPGILEALRAELECLGGSVTAIDMKFAINRARIRSYWKKRQRLEKAGRTITNRLFPDLVPTCAFA